MIEFVIAAFPVLFLGLGSIELSHWFITRQALSLALLEATRAAITDHNRPGRIIAAFEQALRPLHASATAAATDQRLHAALARRQATMDDAPWQIEVLSPSEHAYTDFSDMHLRIDGAPGRPAINNDYLAEQHQRHQALGWTQGHGPVSGQTIYEANTAVLRLSWLHEPHLPLIRPILRALGNPEGSYRQRALARGYLPMTRQIALLMQSHPVHWADDPSAKVLYRPEGNGPVRACSGWLCNSGGGPDGSGMIPIPEFDGSVPAQPGTPVAPPAYGDGTGGSGDYPDWAVNPDDPACGVTLCCV